MNYHKQFEKELNIDLFKECISSYLDQYASWLESRLQKAEEILEWYKNINIYSYGEKNKKGIFYPSNNFKNLAKDYFKEKK